MHNSARLRFPAQDYVKIVASLFAERKSMIIGSLVTATAAATTFFHTGSWLLGGFAVAFVLSGIMRLLVALAFDRANIGPNDADAAEVWELRATIGTCGLALLYGLWTFSCLVYVRDDFSELASTMVSIAVLIGLTSRNFAVDRIVTISSMFIALPLAAGLMLKGEMYHTIMAVLLMPFLFSLRSLARDVREIFLSAVHGRQDAKRLASELDIALTTMPHGLCMIDESGLIAVMNDQIRTTFFGPSDIDFVGKSVDSLIANSVGRDTISMQTGNYLLSELKSGGPSKIVISMSDGRYCEVSIASGNGHSVIVLEDITDRMRANARISHMARHDGLTDLPNRSYFTEQVKARTSQAGPTSSVMMMMVDLDDFKHVNDTLGHPVGDKVLIEVARRLRTVLGPEALVSRFGSDEFMVLREHVNEDMAGDDARAVLAALRVPVKHARDEVRIAASVGVVLTAGGRTDIDTLLTRVDLALYDAKAAGKGRWSLFHDQMDVEYRRRQRLKADLLPALEAGQLFLHYQPIIQLRTRKIVGCEALVRWKHPEFGLIPPMSFIPIAEEMGIISEISRFVLNTAVNECAAWPEALNVSVNLSATDFRMISVEDMVVEALDKSGLEPSRLIIEITETALIEESAKVSRALAELRRLGVGMALDDFGTGYSSLSYLRAMAFSKIKIDRSFIVDIESNRRSQRLLSNITRMSHDLDMTVTVEGIETEEQLKMVADLAEIEHAQGYLFGAPLSASAVREIIERVSAKPNTPAAQLTGS